MKYITNRIKLIAWTLSLISFLIGILCVFYEKRDNASILMTPAFYEAINTIDTDSKKTVTILESIAADTINFNELEKQYYYLYLFYARDKEGLGCIPIERTKDIVDFFSKHNVDSLTQFSLYLHAGAYRDAKDIPSATEWYEKSIDFGKNKDLTHSRFFARSFDQLAYCYNIVFLGEKAISVLKESLKYIEGPYAARVYYRMSAIYDNIGRKDSAVLYAKKSILASSQKMKEQTAVDNINLFIEQRDTAYINRYKDSLLSIDEEDMSPEYATDYAYSKALYYDFIHNTDSTIYYLNKVLAYNANLLTCRNASAHLYENFKKEGFTNEAFKYADLYKQLSDSVIKHTESERVQQVGNMFNYQDIQTKNNEKLQEINSHFKAALWSIVALLFVIILIIAILRFIRKKYKENLVETNHKFASAQQENKILQRNIHHIQNEKELLISEKENLNTSLEIRKKEQESSDNEITFLSNSLKAAQEENSILSKKNEQLISQLVQKGDISDAQNNIEKIKQKINSQRTSISSDLWAEIFANVNTIYPQFDRNIQLLFPRLKLEYVQILYLSCIQISGICIARSLATYPQSVVKRKKRLVEWGIKNNPEVRISDFEQLLELLLSK